MAGMFLKSRSHVELIARDTGCTISVPSLVQYQLHLPQLSSEVDMDDSSEDDRPLGQRRTLDATFLGSDSDNGSPIPAWISQNTPQKPDIKLDSDSDGDLVNLSTQPATQLTTKEGTSSQKALAGKNGVKAKSDRNASLLKTVAKLPGSGSQIPPAGASQAAPQISAIPEAQPGAEIPIMLPEKIQGLRYLVELEGDSEGGADLAGDAGAVGRFSLAGKSGSEQDMLLDLKGRIYNTSLVSCATTFCVINLQPNEARVEAVLENYVSLQEDDRLAQGNERKEFFMYDDDEADAYQVKEEEKQSQKPGKRKAQGENEDAPKAKRKPSAKPPTAKKKSGAKGGNKGGKGGNKGVAKVKKK